MSWPNLQLPRTKVKGTRNEAGWNSVYIAGKIIEKIGPILAIKNKDFYNSHVAEKPTKKYPQGKGGLIIKGLAINSKKSKAYFSPKRCQK